MAFQAFLFLFVFVFSYSHGMEEEEENDHPSTYRISEKPVNSNGTKEDQHLSRFHGTAYTSSPLKEEEEEESLSGMKENSDHNTFSYRRGSSPPSLKAEEDNENKNLVYEDKFMRLYSRAKEISTQGNLNSEKLNSLKKIIKQKLKFYTVLSASTITFEKGHQINWFSKWAQENTLTPFFPNGVRYQQRNNFVFRGKDDDFKKKMKILKAYYRNELSTWITRQSALKNSHERSLPILESSEVKISYFHSQLEEIVSLIEKVLSDVNQYFNIMPPKITKQKTPSPALDLATLSAAFNLFLFTEYQKDFISQLMDDLADKTKDLIREGKFTQNKDSFLQKLRINNELIIPLRDELNQTIENVVKGMHKITGLICERDYTKLTEESDKPSAFERFKKFIKKKTEDKKLSFLHSLSEMAETQDKFNYIKSYVAQSQLSAFISPRLSQLSLSRSTSSQDTSFYRSDKTEKRRSKIIENNIKIEQQPISGQMLPRSRSFPQKLGNKMGNDVIKEDKKEIIIPNEGVKFRGNIVKGIKLNNNKENSNS